MAKTIKEENQID